MLGEAPKSLLPVISGSDLNSIKAAIREEIAAIGETVQTTWLNIDGIEPLVDAPGKFVYRLVLSSPMQFSADQTVTFQTRSPKDTIQAVILRSDDEGLVVECEKTLPTEAKLLSLSFDPAFILRALEKFILEMAPKGGRIASLVVGKVIPDPAPSEPRFYSGLNEEQARAVEEMAATQLHFLWGPPGTGKTTTIGVAVTRWLRQKKRVLLVSTSNAAVDVAILAVLKHLRPEEKKLVQRLGMSLDPIVREVTLGGKVAAQNVHEARVIAKSQERLQKIRELLQNRSMAHDKLHKLYAEVQTCQQQIEDFNRQAALAAPALASGVLVTGCTLAKMVLDANLRQQPFDVVVLDEASMASLLYALAASFLASQHLIYAGDPQQLPPIVKANGDNAARWFGQNIYNWFAVGVKGDVEASRLCLLRTQYRMTNEIGGVVSRLSYDDFLLHGLGKSGPKVEFIDIDGDWQTAHWSVEEKSYYHLATVPLLHALSPVLQHDEVLLLTPFRPQRSLLAALAFDLRQLVVMRFIEKLRDLRLAANLNQRALAAKVGMDVNYLIKLESEKPRLADFFKDDRILKLAKALHANHDQLLLKRKMSASTIHKAQGSEAKAVIVDLTTHSPQQLAAFFRDKHCEKLFNVAISRAKERLVIIGSKAMLRQLAHSMTFWRRFLDEFGKGVIERTCKGLLADINQFDDLSSVPLAGFKNFPAIYSHHSSLGAPKTGIRKLKSLVASRKLLVLPYEPDSIGEGGHIVRTDKGGVCPAVFVGGGEICLPFRRKWLVVPSPNVSQVVWRVGFSHLADEELSGREAAMFFCPECFDGNLVLSNYKGEGWYLVCNNGQNHTCHFRKRLSLKEAQWKVRLQNMTCPMKHPLTARQGAAGFFLGCENYPTCDYKEPLSILSGM